MTKIIVKDNKIIFDGHADNRVDCGTITNIVNTLAKSNNFKEIENKNGYAEFESLKNDEFRFAAAIGELTINFDSNISFVAVYDSSGNIKTKSDGTEYKWTTSGQTIGTSDYEIDNDETFTVVFTSDSYVLNAPSCTYNGYSDFIIYDSYFEINTGSAVPDGTVTLVSKIATLKYDVTINANGGIGTYAFNDVSELKSTDLYYIQQNITRTGYTLIGLAESATGSAISYPYSVTADKTLYCIWEVNDSTETKLTKLINYARAQLAVKGVASIAPTLRGLLDDISNIIATVPTWISFESEDNIKFELEPTSWGHWDGTLEYSTDTTTWTTWTGNKIDSSNDGKLYLRGINNTYISGSNKDGFKFGGAVSRIRCSGNIENLLDYQTVANGQHPEMAADCYNSLFKNCTWLTVPPALPATTLTSNCYCDMFYGCTSLIIPPTLPAMTLADYCYDDMFYGCTSLTTPPELPATTLANYCYYCMFWGCTSLTTAPKLPATTLANHCYQYMFRDCTSLTTTPQLPATTLASYCYSCMFEGCTSLTTAPTLPVTTLASNCYDGMFVGCTSLTIAPELPATTLAEKCYDLMFYGCTSLTTPPELPATTLANYCYYGMFEGCTSLTTAPTLPVTTLADDCYRSMFEGCTSLTTAPSLPSTILNYGCYDGMFSGCTSLTTAPVLSATVMEAYCYRSMFEGCTSLTTPPALPATTLATSCYDGMFEGCTSLTTAPTLPVTTLASNCYQEMFRKCTSLTTPPALPATTLAEKCYQYMFADCTSLIIPPTLPAMTLADYCYDDMFYGCTSLTTPPELPATTLRNYCYYYMFEDCTSIKISSTQTSEYQYAWRIPKSGTGTSATEWNRGMLKNTGGTFTSDPSINKTYYTTNQPV